MACYLLTYTKQMTSVWWFIIDRSARSTKFTTLSTFIPSYRSSSHALNFSGSCSSPTWGEEGKCVLFCSGWLVVSMKTNIWWTIALRLRSSFFWVQRWSCDRFEWLISDILGYKFWRMQIMGYKRCTGIFRFISAQESFAYFVMVTFGILGQTNNTSI